MGLPLPAQVLQARALAQRRIRGLTIAKHAEKVMVLIIKARHVTRRSIQIQQIAHHGNLQFTVESVVHSHNV